MGGEGNKPIRDPGWPKGAAAIFNTQARIAWWEGPPLGGGQWHAECRGDAKTFNAILAEFAKLEAPGKRLLVHDGVTHSFWLNPNREPAKRDGARVDWIFMVWQPSHHARIGPLLRRAGSGATPAGGQDPAAQIDLYIGGNVPWAEVVVPKGLEVRDERMESHGFLASDGCVLEGNVIDLATGKPLVANVRLERLEAQPQGGYRYPTAAEAKTDSQGHWTCKKAPEGHHRLVVEADGFAPRVIGYVQIDDQPRWQSFDTSSLVRPATVTGRVTDDAGRPLEGVDVRITGVVDEGGGRYDSPQDDASLKTDAEGRFRTVRVPTGEATVWIHKSGFCRPGLGLTIKLPSQDVALQMIKAARLRVTVEFPVFDRPKAYIVQIEPEGGSRVGSWGGSGNIDDKDQITFNDVPPGRYVLRGQPNPSSADQHSESVTVELKGGETTDLTLPAK
jgi:protocatechuate 3,4-dioxygenase beta subunit